MRRVVPLAVLLSVTPLLGCTEPPAPPLFRQVVDTKTLMDAVIEKQANIVWEAVGTFITAEGVEERRPQNDQDWKNVRDAAVTLTESANLLLVPSRLQGGEQWTTFTRELIAQGERMIAAADKKSPEDVFNVGADVYDACVNCHTNYMPGVREMYRR